MSPDLSNEDKAELLGGVAYPDGRGWRCSNGHEYPEDYEPTHCCIDGLRLSRALLSFVLPETEGDTGTPFGAPGCLCGEYVVYGCQFHGSDHGNSIVPGEGDNTDG